MRYKSESILARLIKGIGKLALNVAVLGLVLLVSIQFIMANSTLDKKLISKVPYSEYILNSEHILNFIQNDESSPEAEMVFASKEGTLVFHLQGDERPWQVKFLVNQEVVGNFAAGFLEVKVKPGDKLAVDARGYKKGIWLCLAKVSDELDFFKAGQQFWLKNEYKNLGTVKSKTKF